MKYKKWDDFLIHCSGIGKIMTNPQNSKDLTKSQAEKYAKLILKDDKTDKEAETFDVLTKKRERFLNPKLSATAISYLIGRYSKERYNKRRAAVSARLPRIAKGTGLEDDAMQIVSRLHKIEYYKPTEYIKNDFLHGKCDMVSPAGDKIVETKISWSAASFFPYLNKKLPQETWFQIQGYLELYNIDNAQVCYVLVNTPQHLIDQELANLFKRYTYGEISREKFDEGIEAAAGFYNYDNIPLKRRVITFEVARCREIMSDVIKKVDLCRAWLNEFEQVHSKNKKIVTLSEEYVKNRQEDSAEHNPDEPHQIE